MRRAKGTPFRLRSASPLRVEEEGTSEDLGKKVNDKNHLVNVTKNTKPGGRLPTYKEAWEQNLEGIKEKYGNDFNAYKVDMSGIVPGDERDVEREAARDKAEAPKVDYKEKDIPSPAKPGDKMDPFTSSEYRVQTRLGKIAGNKAVQASNKANRADNRLAKFKKRNSDAEGNFIEPKPGDKNHKKYIKLKNTSEIRTEQSNAQRESSRNRFDQLNQGRNASRSGEQIEYRKKMSKGSDGTDFTVASDSDVETYGRTSNLEGYKSGDFDFKAIGKRVADMLGTGTPFKLNNYNK